MLTFSVNEQHKKPISIHTSSKLISKEMNDNGDVVYRYENGKVIYITLSENVIEIRSNNLLVENDKKRKFTLH